MTKSTYTTIKVGKQRLITIPQDAVNEYERVPPLYENVNAYLIAVDGKVPDGCILLIPKQASGRIVPIAVPVLTGVKSKPEGT